MATKILKDVFLELKSQLNTFTLAGFVCFVLIATLIFQAGIIKYQSDTESLKEFVTLEEKRIETYVNYTQYGALGFVLKIKPSPIWAIFYNSTTLGGLEGFVDSGVRLQLRKPQAGENIFERPLNSNLDVSWFLIVIGSMFVILWGFFALRDQENILFRAKNSGLKIVYAAIIIGRALLLICGYMVLTVIFNLQYRINGIVLIQNEIIGLLVLWLTISLFMILLFSLSAAIGTLKNWKIGFTADVALWLIAIFLLPQAFETIYSLKKKDFKNINQHDLQKLSILMDFERMALQKARDKRYKTEEEKIEVDKQNAEQYWDNQLKDIEKLEISIRKKIDSTADNFKFIGTFIPGVFIKISNNEISSMGYQTYSDFHQKNWENQKNFIRYYINKRFYEKYNKVQPFLKPGENVTDAKSMLPRYFLLGILMNLIYIVISLVGCFLMLKRSLFKVAKESAIADLVIEIPFNNVCQLSTKHEDIKKVILKSMFEPTGKIIISNKEAGIFDLNDYVFLSPNGFPDELQVKDLIGYIKSNTDLKVAMKTEYLNKKIGDLEDLEIEDILLSIAENLPGKVIVIDEFLPYEKFILYQEEKGITKIEDRLNELSNKSTVVLLRKKVYGFPVESQISNFRLYDVKYQTVSLQKILMDTKVKANKI